MKIPEPINSLSALIDKAHEDRQEPPRPHLGASLLGHPCDRWLWLSFRWSVIERFQGRILRLFRRGQNEEAQIVSDLRAIGINIVSTGGAQSRVDFGSHVSGSLDGVITHGVPEAPAKKHIAECSQLLTKVIAKLRSDTVLVVLDCHCCELDLVKGEPVKCGTGCLINIK